MSYATGVQVSIPPSAQFRNYFNEETIDRCPECMRSAVRGIVIWTADTMQVFEREIERLQTQDGAVVDLLKKIALVALGTIAACCNPMAALAGAAVGIIFGDKINAGLHALRRSLDQSVFLKISAVIAGVIAAIIAPFACVSGALTAVAFAGMTA